MQQEGEEAGGGGRKEQLTSSHLRERDKLWLRAILCEGFGTDSFLAKPKRMMFPVSFVARKMEMVICFGNVPFQLRTLKIYRIMRNLAQII